MKRILIPFMLAFLALSINAEVESEASKDRMIANLKARVADLEEENKVLKESITNGEFDDFLLIRERNLARKAYREHYLPLYQQMLGEGVALPKTDEIESFRDAYKPMAEIMIALTQ